MTTFEWDAHLGVARYVRAGHILPYGRITHRPNDHGFSTYTAVIYTRPFAQAVALGTFDTDPEARAAIEAVIPLYLSETNL